MEKNEMVQRLVARRVGDGDDDTSSSVTFTVILSTLVAMSGAFAYGNAIGYSSPAKSGIMEDLNLSLAEFAVFGSTLSIGGLLGAVFCGKIADVTGRLGAMGISEAFCITGWLAIVFSKDALWLDLGRLLVGCGCGILYYVAPVYVAEISPKNIRGSFTSTQTLMLSCGKASMYIIGSLINWRASALIGAIPCVLQLLGLFFIPESPRWLAKTNRIEGSEAALQHLRGENADISQEAAEIREYTNYLQQTSDGGIRDLFQRKYVKGLTVGVGLMALQQFSGLTGFSLYASVIFDSAGFPSEVGSIAVALLQILMAALGMFFIDKSGRRPLLLISASGTCLGCVITGLSFLLQDVLHSRKNLIANVALIGVLVYMLSFDLGLGGIPWTIVSEIFPVNVRGSAGSLANVVYYTSGWLVSYTFTYLFEWNSPATFFMYALIGGAGIVFIAKLVPETKGRTLEEIQVSMST